MKKLRVEEEYVSSHNTEVLACKILGLDYDEVCEIDEEIIETQLMEEFQIDLSYFQDLLGRLLPLVEKQESPLTEEVYIGFADKEKGEWIVKTTE